MNKKITAFLLTLAMIITTILGNGFVAKAGGDEEPGADLSSQKVTNTSVSVSFDDEGYYPASLQYAIENFKISLTYELGTVEYLTNWQPNWGNESGYNAYGSKSYQTYNMKFYDGNGEEVDLSSNRVPVGEFTFKIERAWPEEVVYTDTIKIIDPSDLKQNVADGSVTFSSANNKKYEEKWYPANADYSGDFIISKSGDTSSQAVVFVGIWKYENGVAERINEGVYWYNHNSFEHNFTDVDNVYFVAGETNMSFSASTDITWGKKKTLADISIDPAGSYKVWDMDYYNIPLTLTYTDGSTEKCTEWNYSSSINVYGDDVYEYVNGIEYKTKNNDVIYAALKNNDVFYDLAYTEFKPGSYKMYAYAKSNRNINAEADFVVSDFTAETIDLNSVFAKSYIAETDKEAYFICETGEEQKKIAFSNDTSNDASVKFFRIEEESNDFWSSCGSFLVTKETDTNTLSANSKYLIIISTKTGKVNGTIGAYVKGKTVKATVNTDVVDVAKLDAWSKLSVTIDFAAEDGTIIGNQGINSWGTSYSYAGSGYARTKYNETIIYQLYKDNNKVDISSIPEEVLYELSERFGGIENIDPDMLEAIMAELGIPYTKVEPGIYTVKVFCNNTNDDNLIGSKNIEVINSNDVPACKDHEWSKWITVKDATCSAAGLKERTCEVCKKTEEKEIPQLEDHEYNEGAVTVEPTCTSEGVLVKTCVGCDKTIEESIDKLPHEKADAVKASFGVDGTTAGIHCSMCGKSDIEVTPAVAEPTLSTEVYTYNGKTKTPTITVKDVDGKKLKNKVDYTYKFEKSTRKSVGRYKVTVTLKGKYSGKQDLFFTIVPKAPSSVSVSISSSYNTLKASWKKPTGASGYSVYIKAGDGEWSEEEFAFTTSKTFKNLEPGTKYTVKVVPFYRVKETLFYSTSSKTGSAYTLKQLAAPTVTKSGSKVKVKWESISGESGYQISKATKIGSSGTTYTTTSSYKTISATKGKTYYYKVRPYKTISGKKIYGPWSDVTEYVRK